MSLGLAALRLLIIDDNAQIRSIVGAVLAAAGVRQLHYAPDGRRGLQAVRDFNPDICFVDYEMPLMNGLEFVSAVREPNTPHQYLPIIMLTGHSDMRRLNEARDRGVNEFLCKPVNARSILTRLNAVIMQPRPYVNAGGYFGPDRRRRRADGHDRPHRRASDQVNVLTL